MQITRQYSLNRAFANRGIEGTQKEMARLQEQLATARRINRASDDPAGFAVSKKLTEALGVTSSGSAISTAYSPG